MGNRSAAADAFEQTLAELGVDEQDPEIGDARALGRRAALLALAGTLWARHLGPMLSTRQVMELLGVGSRQAVNDRVRRRRILALPAPEGLAYPSFQFDERGEPYPEVAVVLDAFAGAELSPHTIASWLVTPQRLLDRKTPAAWMGSRGDPDLLREAARRSAAGAAGR